MQYKQKALLPPKICLRKFIYLLFKKKIKQHATLEKQSAPLDKLIGRQIPDFLYLLISFAPP
jgi:hypothetical protein